MICFMGTRMIGLEIDANEKLRRAKVCDRESLSSVVHDVWIASTAVEHELPLVSRNTRRFQRVHGLQLLTY
jgi:predicted nucleic acid-binding protein